MEQSYTIFDAEKVQLMTRRRVTRLLIPMGAAMIVCMMLLTIWTAGLLSSALTGFLCLVIIGIASAWILRRRQQLQSIAWCLKISDDDLVGYDYARRKAVWSWTSIIRIEFSDEQTIVTNNKAQRMIIPGTFQDYTELSHLLVAQAEQYDVKIYINGRNFDDLDVYELFPFLLDDSPGPDTTRRSAPH